MQRVQHLSESMSKIQTINKTEANDMTMAGKFSGDIKTRALRISDWVKSSPYYMKMTLMTELGQLFRTTL